MEFKETLVGTSPSRLTPSPPHHLGIHRLWDSLHQTQAARLHMTLLAHFLRLCVAGMFGSFGALDTAYLSVAIEGKFLS